MSSMLGSTFGHSLKPLSINHQRPQRPAKVSPAAGSVPICMAKPLALSISSVLGRRKEQVSKSWSDMWDEDEEEEIREHQLDMLKELNSRTWSQESKSENKKVSVEIRGDIDDDLTGQGGGVLRRERVTAQGIVEAALEATSPLIEFGRHKLELDVSGDEILLDADPMRLTQVVSNLLSNAAKYTPDKGEIRLSLSAEGGDAVFAVTDNGIGMDPETVETMFEMFTQSVHAHDRAAGGLGIGLALVRNIVELHGGTVTGESKGLGLGSRFTVRLPALPESVTIEPVAKPLPVPAEPRISRRVLVVDDNTDNAELLKILLEEEGHETFMAHDGVEGLAAAERLRPDVVLMDLGLPRIDGFDACRRIREQSWGKQILMIAITGWGQDVDRRKSQEAGFDHHLVKPVDANDISALMSGSAAVGQQP